MTRSPAPELTASVVASLRSAGCVFAEDEARLLISAAGTAPELAAMVARRTAGEPLELILGWAGFHGLRVPMERGVFVPRRRTEFLVDQATRLGWRDCVVLDLCCGSGAVGLAIAVGLAGVDLYAVDVEPAAVRCARRNVAPVGGQVYQGDLFEPLPSDLRGRVDLLVANAPYVPSEAISQMPSEARDHEPRVALDGGDDGLDVQRRIAASAGAWLSPDGHLLVETSERQAPASRSVLEAHGFAACVARSDDLDATVTIARRRPGREP